MGVRESWAGEDLPDCDHVVVHPLQLLLRGLECVWGRVELVSFKALVGEFDLEEFIIFLTTNQRVQHDASAQAAYLWHVVLFGV